MRGGSQLDRFSARYIPEPNSGCWLWEGHLNQDGYGTLGIHQAHRVAWKLLCGPIRSDHDIDHLCRNRCCVNPAHLEPVTTRVNVLRGQNFSAFYAVRTHCDAGHPYDGDNLIYRKDGGRRCRQCKRDAGRSFMRRKRSALTKDDPRRIGWTIKDRS